MKRQIGTILLGVASVMAVLNMGIAAALILAQPEAPGGTLVVAGADGTNATASWLDGSASCIISNGTCILALDLARGEVSADNQSAAFYVPRNQIRTWHVGGPDAVPDMQEALLPSALTALGIVGLVGTYFAWTKRSKRVALVGAGSIALVSLASLNIFLLASTAFSAYLIHRGWDTVGIQFADPDEEE